jgi:hypothetical protein
LPVLDQAQVPAAVPQRSWQATARAIRRFAADDPVESWLCNELATYLFQEQPMDPEALRPEHLTALAYYDEAAVALAVICQRAAEYLRSDEALGPPTDEEPKSGAYGIGYSAWWTNPPGWNAELWNGAWFDWGIRTANTATEMPGVHLFAGMSIQRPSAFDPEMRHALEQGIPRSELVPGEPIWFRYWSGRDRRLRRLAQPQDVLVGMTLEAQGESLGRWVVETFRALRAYGPTPTR